MRGAIVLAGLALGVLAYRVQVNDLGTTHVRAQATVAAGLAFLAAGLAAWSRRPGNGLGPLMIAAGFALLARQLRYSHDHLPFTTFFAVGELGYALVAHVALAYPSGTIRDRWDRMFVRITYGVVIGFPIAVLLFYDGSRQLRYYDPDPRESDLLLYTNGHLARALQDAYAVVAYGILASVFVLLIARKLIRATPRARRLLAPLLLAAVVAALRAVFDSVLTFSTPPISFVYDNVFWWQIVGLIALPVALVAGLLRARLAQASVGDLVLRLERAPSHRIRDELAEALGDPSLEVALWLPERREYVDAEGRTVTLPDDGPLRAVTKLEHDGEPIAALVHDGALREEPELISGAAAAARLALENARLNAELLAKLAKVKESRARLVSAADEERRRIERNLHDGLQQRLVAIALEARSAQRRLGERADPEVEALLQTLADETHVAVQELRELARGIHPAILSEDGLAAALEALASRSPLPVDVDAPPGRLPSEVEVAAYFVACEALVNVAKHAAATKATIAARRENGRLVVEVTDDGVGGARLDPGSGLSGLVDRVEALSGRLTVAGGPQGGTLVRAEIPIEAA